jgi:hypothetical protein
MYCLSKYEKKYINNFKSKNETEKSSFKKLYPMVYKKTNELLDSAAEWFLLIMWFWF